MQDKMSIYEATQELLLCELDKLIKKEEITPSTLDYLDKIVDMVKDLDEMLMSEYNNYNEGYSQRSGRYPYNQRMTYRGNSYGYDGGGRMNNSMNSSMRSGQYSRGDGKDEMLDHLYMALDRATNEDERRRVKKMIDDIENS